MKILKTTLGALTVGIAMLAAPMSANATATIEMMAFDGDWNPVRRRTGCGLRVTMGIRVDVDPVQPGSHLTRAATPVLLDIELKFEALQVFAILAVLVADAFGRTGANFKRD